MNSRYVWEDGFESPEIEEVVVEADVPPTNKTIRFLKRLWKRVKRKLFGREFVPYVHVEPRILGDCCSLEDNPATKPADPVWDDPETATNLLFVRPDLRYLAADRLELQGYWNRKHEGIRESQGEKPRIGVTINYS